jgi:energy-coupling factor transport system substrate-specific component
MLKSKRIKTAIKYLMPFILIPAFTIAGSLLISEKRHLFVSLGVTLLSLLLFYSGVERKNIGTRRMVGVAVMSAFCVFGRLLPYFKPVTAITTISALYLGSEAGFLVGSLSAFLSNFYFGQGPWTAFQMLALGLIGFIAGMLSETLKKNRPLLLAYGVVSGVAYSFIMDIWTVLWYAGGFDAGLYLAALTSAVPYTVSYAFSNFIFLYLLAGPLGRKLERVRIKYGL